MHTFLSVGTSKIDTTLQRPIINGETKPKGGLWATEQDPQNTYYNTWINFLSTHLHLLYYKKVSNPFLVPAVFITLKEDANIFYLNNQNKLNFLKKYYPTPDGWIDFERLSEDYAGIYIDISQIYTSDIPIEEKRKIAKFDVSSLIIFDLECIDYYQQAQIDIEPFDYEFEHSFQYYTITIDERKNKIEFSPSTNTSMKDSHNTWDVDSLPMKTRA